MPSQRRIQLVSALATDDDESEKQERVRAVRIYMQPFRRSQGRFESGYVRRICAELGFPCLVPSFMTPPPLRRVFNQTACSSWDMEWPTGVQGDEGVVQVLNLRKVKWEMTCGRLALTGTRSMDSMFE